MCTLSVFTCVLVALALQRASAYPQFWISPSLNVEGPSPPGEPKCLEHPTRGWGPHKGVSKDTAITFKVSAGGKSVNKVCPGKTYKVEIDTGFEGFALLTASQGSLSMSSDTCKGRVAFDPNYNSQVDGLYSKWTTDLELPCTATGNLELIMSASAVEDDAYHQNRATMPLDPSCSCEKATTTPAAKTPSSTDTTPPSTTSTETPGTTTPAATTQTTTTQATSTAASAASSTVTSFTTPMCKQPIQTSNTTCPKSALGYACSSTLDGMTLHYTVGGCPPSNPCTASYALRNPSASAAQPYLHMAASYPTTGYVSLGFARNPGSMPGTDAVIGWAMDDGTPRINSYYVDGTSVSSSNMYANAGQWMVLAGVVQEGGITTMCFSRPADASSSKVAPQLKSSGAVGMNWAYSGNGRKALVQHAAAGGFVFHPTLGGGVTATLGTNFMLIHGVLMGLAWIELIPLGVLLARHKTLMGDRKLCGIHVWFHLHRIVQLVAVVVFAGGLALAYLKLSEPQGGIGKAHGILAWVLIALVGLQLVVSFLRPKPTESLRKYWNLLHWNVGRLAAAVGIANTYIGVKVYKRQRLENVTVWYIVISVILGVYLVADVLLSVWGRKAAKVAAQQQHQQHQQHQHQQQQEHQAAVNKGAAIPLPADVEIALQRLS